MASLVAEVGSPGRSRERVERVERVERGDRLPVVAVAIAIAGLPLLLPKGPGHSAPADVLIGAAVMVVLLWAASVRARVRLPYAAPVAVLVIAGALGGLAGDQPSLAATALGQDLFMLAWCAAIVTLARTPAALGAMLSVWAWSAIAWSAILIGAVATGHRALAGVGAQGVGRARFMFDNPNLAGSYFAVSLFVVLLAGRPRNKAARGGAVFLVFAAVVLTGSNAALLGIAVGGLVSITVAVARRVDLVAGVAILLILVVAGAAGWYALARAGAASDVHKSQNRFLRYSIARGDRSLNAREDLFKEELDLFRSRPLSGNGPNSTRDVLSATPTAKAKQAHSDYLATLVERGPLGAVALVALIAAVAIRLTGTAPGALKPGFARVAPGTAALVGAAVLIAVSAITHEVLHYRHVWALFGILAAIHSSGRAGGTAGEAPR